MSTIQVSRIAVTGKNLKISFSVDSSIEKYFTSQRVLEIHYSEDITSVPESILVIPFVCNVLPIVWLTDATLKIPQLDREFYEGIPGVKQGYIDMSPMLFFKGNLQIEQLVSNSYVPSDKTAALFSGGVDAFATLIGHAEEKPQLVTLWGADIKLDDSIGWAHVRKHTEQTSSDYGLPAPMFIRSNFRTILDEGTLGDLVASSKDSWWHGYQHGIAILGHTAPIAYLHHWKTLYIASSYTRDNKTICASDPTIDNKLHLVSTRVYHDQYEYHRQQKVEHIVSHCRSSQHKINVRVCWITAGGKNCCKCEKCLRTIFSFLAEGEDPANYGFSAWRKGIEGAKSSTPKYCRYTPKLRRVYAQIQARFRETQAYRNDSSISWFYKVNFHQTITLRDRLRDTTHKTLNRWRKSISKRFNKWKQRRNILGRWMRSIEKRFNKSKAYDSFVSMARLAAQQHLTYYPDEAHKSQDQIQAELLELLKTNAGWTPEMTIDQYFQFGCDRLSVKTNEYVFQREYDLRRDNLNGELAALYKFKSIAGIYLKARGINASCALGQISATGEEIYLHDGSIQKLILWLAEHTAPVFCKPDDGIQGKECYQVVLSQDKTKLVLNGEELPFDKAKAILSHLIVEPLIIQHKDLKSISPLCVNPLRVRTICNDRMVKHISSYICLGFPDSYWSNGASCGIMVGLDNDGHCITDGFCEVPGMEGRYTELPATEIQLKDITIPGVKEAIELAKKAHLTTPQVYAIGWDIAITDKGPIIIEGNGDYGTCTYQAISGIGERDFFEKEFERRASMNCL